jgi:hypothetical protein
MEWRASLSMLLVVPDQRIAVVVLY